MAKLLDELTAQEKQTAAERETEHAELRTAYERIISRSDKPAKGDVEEIQRLAKVLDYEPGRIAADVEVREEVLRCKDLVATLPRIEADQAANATERETIERESKALETRDRDRMGESTMLRTEHTDAQAAQKKLAKLIESHPGLCAD